MVADGTTGIGRAVAAMAAGRGARVLIFGRHEAELEEAVREIRGAGGEAHGVAADQSSVADVRRVFAEADALLGGVDVLVNNAGVDYGPLGEHDLEDVQYVVNTNLVGYIACAREAVRRMSGGGGHIVNVGSMSADLREEENSVYVATKAAIQAFSDAPAGGRRRLRAVLPGTAEAMRDRRRSDPAAPAADLGLRPSRPGRRTRGPSDRWRSSRCGRR